MTKVTKIEGYDYFKSKDGKNYITYSDGVIRMPEGEEIPYSLNSQFEIIHEFFEKELKEGKHCLFSFNCNSFEDVK